MSQAGKAPNNGPAAVSSTGSNRSNRSQDAAVAGSALSAQAATARTGTAAPAVLVASSASTDSIASSLQQPSPPLRSRPHSGSVSGKRDSGKLADMFLAAPQGRDRRSSSISGAENDHSLQCIPLGLVDQLRARFVYDGMVQPPAAARLVRVPSFQRRQQAHSMLFGVLAAKTLADNVRARYAASTLGAQPTVTPEVAESTAASGVLPRPAAAAAPPMAVSNTAIERASQQQQQQQPQQLSSDLKGARSTSTLVPEAEIPQAPPVISIPLAPAVVSMTTPAGQHKKASASDGAKPAVSKSTSALDENAAVAGDGSAVYTGVVEAASAVVADVIASSATAPMAAILNQEELRQLEDEDNAFIEQLFLAVSETRALACFLVAQMSQLKQQLIQGYEQLKKLRVEAAQDEKLVGQAKKDQKTGLLTVIGKGSQGKVLGIKLKEQGGFLATEQRFVAKYISSPAMQNVKAYQLPSPPPTPTFLQPLMVFDKLETDDHKVVNTLIVMYKFAPEGDLAHCKEPIDKFDFLVILKDLRRFKIFHGDIKPANILVFGRRLCLADMETYYRALDIDNSLTFPYSPAYAPPNFRDKSSPSLPSISYDCWSMGVTAAQWILSENGSKRDAFEEVDVAKLRAALPDTWRVMLSEDAQERAAFVNCL